MSSLTLCTGGRLRVWGLYVLRPRPSTNRFCRCLHHTLSLSAPPLAPPALTNAHSHSVPLMPSRACGKCAVCMYMHICIYVCVYVCVYLFVHIGMCMYTERERERERERKASSKSRMLPCHGVSRPRGTGSVGDSVGEGRA